jgi:hypothetical protein
MTDLDTLARREFAGEPRDRATDAMVEVLAEVPAGQLTPLSDKEIVRLAKRKLKRRADPSRIYRTGGFR